MTKSILARCYLVVKVNEVIYICDTVPPCMENSIQFLRVLHTCTCITNKNYNNIVIVVIFIFSCFVCY